MLVLISYIGKTHPVADSGPGKPLLVYQFPGKLTPAEDLALPLIINCKYLTSNKNTLASRDKEQQCQKSSSLGFHLRTVEGLVRVAPYITTSQIRIIQVVFLLKLLKYQLRRLLLTITVKTRSELSTERVLVVGFVDSFKTNNKIQVYVLLELVRVIFLSHN